VRAEAAYSDASQRLVGARREAGETQSRAHELQVETLRLSQLAEQTRARSEQLAADLAEVDAQLEVLQERRVTDAASGELLASVSQTSMLRADGGFGGAHGAPLAAPHAMPARPPDAVCDLPTLPQAALLYRLSGDFNPLHADPGVALAAGFPRPILHGLATMGIALHAVLRMLLGYDASAVRGMRVRFTAPVLPGETLRTELWRDGCLVSLRTTALERNTLVLNAGRVDLA